jgi:hypothetical protein
MKGEKIKRNIIKKVNKLALKSREGPSSDANLAISKNKTGSPAKTKALFRKVLEFC